MLKELLARWERCFATDSPSEEDERLFRSLNMSHAASLMPAGVDNKLYDVLRSVALWASAFEILRPSRREAYRQIYDLLEGITWNLTDCNQDLYTVLETPRARCVSYQSGFTVRSRASATTPCTEIRLDPNA